MQSNYAVILHGGASSPESLAPDYFPDKKPGLKKALEAAWGTLTSGKGARAAVVAALRELEDDQYFDAGYGGYPNEDGEVFLDIALMSGKGEFISLLNIERVRFPSSLADSMWREGVMSMLVWTDSYMQSLDTASEDFKSYIGWVSSHQEMVAPYAKKVAERNRARVMRKIIANREFGDTVGCVVRDSDGSIFAGTSTGGTPLKIRGRIGDAPIIGAGVYSDNEICGLSSTGMGEAILSSSAPAYVISRMRDGTGSTEEIKKILSEELLRLKKKHPIGEAGIIVMPKKGDPVFDFNSRVLSVGYKFINEGGSLVENVDVAQNPSWKPD